MDTKVVFITINPGGLGKAIAREALVNGNKVIVTVNKLLLVEDLISVYGENILALEIDLTDREECFASVNNGLDHFGRIDIAVDGGFNLTADTPMISKQELKALVENELYGISWLVQAMIPIMKGQKMGHILQVVGAHGLNRRPVFGHHSCSTWSPETLLESLSGELKPFGMKFTMIHVNGGGKAHDEGFSLDNAKPIVSLFNKADIEFSGIKGEEPSEEVLKNIYTSLQAPLALHSYSGELARYFFAEEQEK